MRGLAGAPDLGGVEVRTRDPGRRPWRPGRSWPPDGLQARSRPWVTAKTRAVSRGTRVVRKPRRRRVRRREVTTVSSTPTWEAVTGACCAAREQRPHHGVPPDPERATDLAHGHVLRRRRDRRPRRALGPHCPRCDRRSALHEGPTPGDADQQPRAPPEPTGPCCDREVAHVVRPLVVERMPVDNPAPWAGLDVTGAVRPGRRARGAHRCGRRSTGTRAGQLAPPLGRVGWRTHIASVARLAQTPAILGPSMSSSNNRDRVA